ncbi:MAG: hypothetical protein IT440_09650 [Phycisphaeraceae bacterium]|nr:hypothetical protein [Phycisphaeraceae bacterium]
MLSETLEADEQIKGELVKGVKLVARDVSGVEQPVTEPVLEAHSGTVTLPGGRCAVVYGSMDMGVKQREDKSYLLMYHTKSIVGDALDRRTLVGYAAPVEIVPVGVTGQVQFEVLIAGKPAAGVEVNVLLPDGTKKKPVTDEQGRTPAYDMTGRFGAWTRYFEPLAGKRDDKRYDEVRHYAMLVATVGAPQPVAEALKPLPEAVSSFGGVAMDGYLYIYGGHRVQTHQYNINSVSGGFHRIALDSFDRWETLPAGPALQGMNLAAHEGKVYRVGGMRPVNPPDQPSDNHSVADVASYDPRTGQWTAMPSLPAPRSSHDVVFAGDKLYVIGGWAQQGRAAGNVWHDHALVLDVAQPQSGWQRVEQPFVRRALIVAPWRDLIYVIGGLAEDGNTSHDVDIYDPARNVWFKGPSLPGGRRNGFSPAACTLGDRLYVSLADGSVQRLDESSQRWEQVACNTPRLVHRMVPRDQRLLVIGGSGDGRLYDLIESIVVSDRLSAR